MNYNARTFQRVGNHVRVWTLSILLVVLSACTQATPDVTTTKPSSATPSSTTEPTSLPPTSTAIIPSSTAAPLPESDISFQAFPVTEGETIALVNGRVIDGTGAPAWLD